MTTRLSSSSFLHHRVEQTSQNYCFRFARILFETQKVKRNVGFNRTTLNFFFFFSPFIIVYPSVRCLQRGVPPLPPPAPPPPTSPHPFICLTFCMFGYCSRTPAVNFASDLLETSIPTVQLCQRLSISCLSAYPNRAPPTF